MADTTRTLRPFNVNAIATDDIYSHLPYVKDIELCTKAMIRMNTGNIIKYYSVSGDEAVTIDTNDLADHLVRIGYEANARYLAGTIEDSSIIDMPSYEDDPAARLMADMGEDDGPLLADAFAGIDDDEDEDDFSFLRKKK